MRTRDFKRENHIEKNYPVKNGTIIGQVFLEIAF